MRLVTKGLNRNERLIIILYYYEELTMKEIGATLDLSESRVSQMHSLDRPAAAGPALGAPARVRDLTVPDPTRSRRGRGGRPVAFDPALILQNPSRRPPTSSRGSPGRVRARRRVPRRGGRPPVGSPGPARTRPSWRGGPPRTRGPAAQRAAMSRSTTSTPTDPEDPLGEARQRRGRRRLQVGLRTTPDARRARAPPSNSSCFLSLIDCS